MSDRNERSDRLSRRLDDEPDESEETTTGSGETEEETQSAEPDTDESSSSSSGSSKSSKTDMPGKTGGENPPSTSVKARPSVLMYLPEDLHQEMDIRFDELNAAAKREFGEGLEKNRHWYPLLLSLALDKADEMSTEELLARLDDTEN
jgi:DNA replication initiation complex subunit (GINS family)